MKLTNEQIAAARDTLGASPVDPEHPAVAQLEQAFGEHTFYVDQNGLLVFVDPVELDQEPGDPRLVLIAAWTDDEKRQLGAVNPVDTGVTLPVAAE